MNNILEYIKWRGDLNFSDSPFNEVDNLIFTQLSYLDFSGIVSASVNESIYLDEAWEKYRSIGRKPESVILPEEIYELFKEMAGTKRFSKIKLSGYVAKLDVEKEKQFGALTIKLPKMIYVSFRGTDDNIVGWKEDFNLAFMESIPAQREAYRYLFDVLKNSRFTGVYVGGHSKGGNLSVFAAMHMPKAYQKRIIRVYSNDGPGFLENVVKSKEYESVMDKIFSIVPEGSVIGQLLSHGKADDIIVKNDSSVLRQHDPFTWQVLGNGFVTVDSLNEQSIATDAVITAWLSNMDAEERENFAEAIYELLTVTDAKTLKDIFSDKFGFLKALKNLSKEARKDIGKSIGQIIEQIAKIKSEK